MDIVNCFGNIVGLTHSLPSDSGLYITDLEAVSTIEGLTIEQSRTVTDILDDARRVAILSLSADLTALLMKYADFRKPFRGKIGSSRWSTKATGGAELVLLCRPLPSAVMKISKLGVIFQSTGAKQVHLSSNTGITQTFDVNSEANKVSVIEVNLELPLYSETADVVEYRFSHDEDFCAGKLQPCGSCRFKFSYDRPVFTNTGINAYLNVAGYKNGKYLNMSAGLLLYAEIQCKIDSLLCDEEMDFSVNPVAQMYAQAIQYKAGSVVVWNCLRNPNLNRVLMENSDDLREAAKYYERRYRDMMLFINKHMDYDHDCVCKKRASWIGGMR